MIDDETEQTAEVFLLFAMNEPRRVSPAESLRLLRAFLAVDEPGERLKIIELAERLSSAPDDDPL